MIAFGNGILHTKSLGRVKTLPYKSGVRNRAINSISHLVCFCEGMLTFVAFYSIMMNKL